jgi:outer membrane protein assembly factor BamD (BamD/ComL family)
LSGCATLHELELKKASQEKIQSARKLLAKGDYDGSLQINQELLALFPDRPPGDEALYLMGLIHVHNDNPNKDYKKSHKMFKRLAHDFPQSRLIEEAKLWIGLLEMIEEERNAHASYMRSKELILKNGLNKSLKEYQKILSRFPDRPPGDEALFNMGLIYIHNDNPRKNYKKSLQMFKRLKHDFPKSPLFEEANIWIGLLEVIEKSKQADIEIEEKKKELAQ